MTFIGYSYKVLHLCDKLLKRPTIPYKYKTTADMNPTRLNNTLVKPFRSAAINANLCVRIICVYKFARVILWA